MDSSNLARKKKILVVFGTRPEAIKLAPVVREFQCRPESYSTIVCVTGQHREMLEQMLQSFQLRPDYNLDVMKPNQSLASVTTSVLNGVAEVIQKEEPDLLIVQGDTTTTFAGSLAAFYHRVPVAHVEAGLRTGDRYSPFPEEINRRLTTHLAEFHFPPTELSRANLLQEGVSDERILVTGNTVVDALHYMVDYIGRNPALVPEFLRQAPNGHRMILVTAHRRESFGAPMLRICQAIRRLAETRPDVQVIYPVHLNPNVQEPVRRTLQGLPNVLLLDPLDYVSMIAAMRCAHILLTDSGGMQEEGPALKKPVLVMRPVSERPEAIMAGAAALVGTDPDRILTMVNRLLDQPEVYRQMTSCANPFGDGKASARIVDFLEKNLFGREESDRAALPRQGRLAIEELSPEGQTLFHGVRTL